MKKILSFILIFSLILISLSGFTYGEGEVETTEKINNLRNLSSMSEEECLVFIQEKGIEIPEELKNIPELGQFVKSIIKQAEDFPQMAAPYNYTVTRDFALKIRDEVNHYYKANELLIKDNVIASYTLQDSTVFGPWKDSYLNYNCYGHAIGMTNRFVNPGYYSNKPFSINMSIIEMANNVIYDLDVLGYWAYRTTTRPTSLRNYEQAICIRKGSIDYHFMRFNGSLWTHKPGNTAVLRWNYTSPQYKVWTNECSFMGVEYPPTTQYNSTVQYIIYWPKGAGPSPESVEDTTDISL